MMSVGEMVPPFLRRSKRGCAGPEWLAGWNFRAALQHFAIVAAKMGKNRVNLVATADFPGIGFNGAERRPRSDADR
jgi:hypothetical protein